MARDLHYYYFMLKVVAIENRSDEDSSVHSCSTYLYFANIDVSLVDLATNSSFLHNDYEGNDDACANDPFAIVIVIVPCDSGMSN